MRRRHAEAQRHLIARPSPGHQAGAPLRHVVAVEQPGDIAGLPPAIRPGLHCGGGIKDALSAPFRASPGHQAGAPLRLGGVECGPFAAVVFPRPSGRGSIAATRRCRRPTCSACFPRPSGRGSIAARSGWPACRVLRPASPGHQAGAPLRLRVHLVRLGSVDALPPAIRPGLHCGTPSLSNRPNRASLPPAIRPGLHCGLDHMRCQVSHPQLPPAIRPGLHCGSVSAHPRRHARHPLPPAIRPGLHCGQMSGPSSTTFDVPSPGHQAGAPLRRSSVER